MVKTCKRIFLGCITIDGFCTACVRITAECRISIILGILAPKFRASVKFVNVPQKHLVLCLAVFSIPGDSIERAQCQPSNYFTQTRRAQDDGTDRTVQRTDRTGFANWLLFLNLRVMDNSRWYQVDTNFCSRKFSWSEILYVEKFYCQKNFVVKNFRHKKWFSYVWTVIVAQSMTFRTLKTLWKWLKASGRCPVGCAASSSLNRRNEFMESSGSH